MDSDGSDDPNFENSNDQLLIAVWIIALCMFLSLPFCSNAKKRQLWRQRLRERRWIAEEEDENDWYRQAVERGRSERRQAMEEEQERFRTSKTQEDEIREQYLFMLLGKHSITLSTSDIHQLSETLKRSSSEGSMSVNTVGKSVGKESTISDTDQTATPSSDGSSNKEVDIEAPAPSSSSRARSNSVVSDDDDGDALQEMNFDRMNAVVYVPLPGEETNSEVDGTNGRHRRVPNGCAICLGQFTVGEKISWSSNGKCSHVFHHDCLVHWFHAVGRKVRKKQLHLRPDMDGVEALDLLCKFPKLCPCCRQAFCMERKDEEGSKDLQEDDGRQEPTLVANGGGAVEDR